MKKIIFASALIFSFLVADILYSPHSKAAPPTPGTIPSITIGGRVFTDLSTNLIVLISGANAAANYTTFRRPFASAGYQVTAGKTLYVTAMQYRAAAVSAIGMGYSDNDVGLNVAGPPTNWIQMMGAAQAFDNFSAVVGAYGNEKAVWYPIPAGKYITWNGYGASMQNQIVLWGYEK